MRSISVVPVLPTEPVTATTEPFMRARARRRSAQAPRADRRARRGAARGPSARCPSSHDAQAPRRPSAPPRRNHGRRGSRRVIATKASPGPMVRVSIDTPAIAGGASPCKPAAGRGDEIRRLPERAHSLASGGSQRLARLFLVGERKHLVADRLPGLVTLAGDEQDVALAQARRSAVRIATPRSPISSAFGAPLMTALRIVAGSSLRGLSSVTITRSAIASAASPISGRLPGSRSPPAPKTTMSLPRRVRAKRASAHWRARRACGRSRRRPARRMDARRQAPAGRSRLSARRGAASAFRASTPVAIASAAATSAFDIWNSPTSGSGT